MVIEMIGIASVVVIAVEVTSKVIVNVLTEYNGRINYDAR